MQQAFTVTINGRGGAKKIKEIEKAAASEEKSRSEFMLWLYEKYAARKRRPIEAGSIGPQPI